MKDEKIKKKIFSIWLLIPIMIFLVLLGYLVVSYFKIDLPKPLNYEETNIGKIIEASYNSGCEQGCSHTLYYLRDKKNMDFSNISKYPCLEICGLK